MHSNRTPPRPQTHTPAAIRPAQPASRSERRIEAGYETGSSDDSLHPTSAQGTLFHLPHRQIEREPFADPALYALPFPAPQVVSGRHRLVEQIHRLLPRLHRHRHPAPPIRLVRVDPPPPPTGPFRYRPDGLAFQRYAELVEGLHQAPAEDFPKIAQALALRLRRADLVLPSVRHTSAEAMRLLMGRHWHRALAERRLHVAELLSVIGDPRAAGFWSPDMRSRIVAALGTVVALNAPEHAGLETLRLESLRPLRPWPPEWLTEAAQAAPRMQAFVMHARRMLALSAALDATAGQLAVGLNHCLTQGQKIGDGEGAAVIGQVRPAVAQLLQEGRVPRPLTARLRQAAERLEAVLQLKAGLDLEEPDRPVGNTFTAGSAAGTLATMTSRQARSFLLARLMDAALNPAELEGLIHEQKLQELMHPVLFQTERDREDADGVIRVLRLALRPMVDTGLMSNDQRHALMAMAKRALRENRVYPEPVMPSPRSEARLARLGHRLHDLAQTRSRSATAT